MKLNNEQTEELRTYLMHNRTCIIKSGERESSRIEGETCDGDRDARGYRSVVVYIERGLGDQIEVVRQVLDIAARVQNNNNLEYPIFLFSFGWDDGTLHHPVKCRNGGPGINSNGWAQALCDLATVDNSPKQAMIPTLFPPVQTISGKRKVERDDLLIFFCKDRSVCLSEEARIRYSLHPAKQSIWIYCEDGSPNIELGAREANMCNNPNQTETTMINDPASNNPAQSELSTNTIKSKRDLKSSFMTSLDSGILRPLLNIVLSDDTLSLNIRRDCINIYYRGGNLLKIFERSGVVGQFEFFFDDQYVIPNLAASMGLPIPKLGKSHRLVSTNEDVALWANSVPALKCAMDLWLCKNPKLERELQQLTERMNNRNHATDYFICDIEYTNATCPQLRADLIALYWPSTPSARKRLDCGRLAIIEMKHGDNALSGKSGIIDHIKQLNSAAIDYSDLCEEMKGVFNQRVKLGLITCHSDGDKQPEIKYIAADDVVDYIILFSDHDPASRILLRELQDLQIYLKEKSSEEPSRVNIRVALATFMGYGLYEESIYNLDDFLKRFRVQISSSSETGDRV